MDGMTKIKINLKISESVDSVLRRGGSHRSLFSNWCRPLYGEQSLVDAGMKCAKRAALSVTTQQCSYERVQRSHALTVSHVRDHLSSSRLHDKDPFLWSCLVNVTFQIHGLNSQPI